MPKIEECPFPDCHQECRIEIGKQGSISCWIRCYTCGYESGVFATEERAIAAHNALSIKVRRAEQLRHFAELAVPIVDFAFGYFKTDSSAMLLDGTYINDACAHALAAYPKKSVSETLMDVYVDEAINPDDKKGGSDGTG